MASVPSTQHGRSGLSTNRKCHRRGNNALYSEICLYPNAERIFLIQDNRPVHLHPNLLAVFNIVFHKPLPPSWKGKLSKKIGELAKLPTATPDLRPMDESVKVGWTSASAC